MSDLKLSCGRIQPPFRKRSAIPPCLLALSIAALVICANIAASPAIAESKLKPLSDLIGKAAAPYPFVRCGGMYQAVMEWGGEKRLGEQTWKNTDEARLAFIFAAAIVGVQNGFADFDEATDITIRDVRNVADIYLKRFEANYASDGQAWGNDDLVWDDLETCKEVAVLAEQIVLQATQAD